MSHERERVCFVWHERERARARDLEGKGLDEEVGSNATGDKVLHARAVVKLSQLFLPTADVRSPLERMPFQRA